MIQEILATERFGRTAMTPGSLSKAWTTLLVLLLSCASPSLAAGQYGLKEILSKTKIEKAESPVTTPLRLVHVESAAGGGWNGTLDDRWHSSDAFRGNFRDEFLEGLTYYLQKRGFVVSSSPEAVLVKVTIDHFEGRKRVHDDGGDLQGTLTLVRDGRVIGKKELSESLSYRDESDECPAFEKEFSLTAIHFSTVLFYRLSLSFYRSIEAGIVDSLGTKTSPGVEGSSGGSTSQATSSESPGKAQESGLITIESSPDAAEILLDGKLVATTPARELRLPAGNYKLILRKTGYQDWIRELTVLGGNNLTLKASLVKSGQ